MKNLFPSLVLGLVTAATPTAQSFSQNDVYLFTPAATGLSTGQGGVIRIDPSSGVTTLVRGGLIVQAQTDGLEYCPYRDRMLFSMAPTLNDPVGLVEMDASGTITSTGQTNLPAQAMAAVGDGRVYLRRVSWPAGGVWYLDAANQFHTLLDASGTQAFTFAPGEFFQYQQMIYHAETNSLIAIAGSNAPTCGGGGSSAGIVARRVQLSADGTRGIGPVTCSEFDISVTFESVVGLTRMDDGDLLVVVDTNSSSLEPRMVRLDPISLTMTTFASNTHFAAAATNAGCYSSTLGRALILDTGNDVLRAFSQGETGAGTTITPIGQWVSPSGSSNETATMLQIDRQPCPGSAVLYGQGAAGTDGHVPATTLTGCPRAGETVFLHVTSGLGAANGALVVGSAPASIPVLGGTLLVTPLFSAPITLGGAAGLGGAGTLSIPLSIAASTPVDWNFQALLLDAGAAQGVSMSNGLDLTIAP